MRILATFVALCALGPRCVASNQGDLLAGSQRTGGSLEGRVTTLFGEPLPDAHVTVVVGGYTPSSGVQTSKDGTFRLTDLPAGRLEVEARMPGFETEKVEVTLHSGEIERLDLGLQLTNLADSARCRVHGRATDAKGRPGVGDSVAGSAAFNVRIGGVAGIDQDGRYDLYLPVPGHYVLWVRGVGGVPQAKVLTCRADRNTDEAIDFEIPAR